MKNRNFREMLKIRQEKINSFVCVGLDPLPEKIPFSLNEGLLKEWQVIERWIKYIIVATARYASMYKLQSACYESLEEGGRKVLQLLQSIIDYIHEEYPDIPVFLDCKRGDIDRTQERYRIAHFDIDNADGINFNPYMGKTCMKGLVDKNFPGRAIVGLGRTSNPEAWETQDVKLSDDKQYWEYIVERVLAWADELEITQNAGIVMGAAHKASLLNGHVCHPVAHYKDNEIYYWHLARAREIVDDKLWFLVPGVGTQKGFVRETVRSVDMGYGSFAINSSSGIIFASQGDNFAEAAAKKAKELRDEINKYR